MLSLTMVMYYLSTTYMIGLDVDGNWFPPKSRLVFPAGLYRLTAVRSMCRLLNHRKRPVNTVSTTR